MTAELSEHPTPLQKAIMGSSSVYIVSKRHDDPRYQGFFYRGFPERLPRNRTDRSWQVLRLASTWTPLQVRGRVRKFNDYPCVNFALPAFSKRAVDVLHDLLARNGEILPLASPIGSYFYYNLTTVADVLNVERSAIRTTRVDKYVFLPDRVRDLIIFCTPETPMDVYVTEPFIARVRDNGILGMRFQKVWPLASGVSWWELSKAESRALEAEGLPPGQTIKGNAIIIVLRFADRLSKGNEAERRAIDLLMNQLDTMLVEHDYDAPAVGNLEGSDYGVLGECRLFLSCPDADALTAKLMPWFEGIGWPNEMIVIKRCGHFTDPKAPESLVRM